MSKEVREAKELLNRTQGHTPGPWVDCGDGDFVSEVVATRIVGTTSFERLQPNRLESKQELADARLCASAPSMRELLSWAIGELELRGERAESAEARVIELLALVEGPLPDPLQVARDEFVERLTCWMLRKRDAEYAKDATASSYLDKLYEGSSARIARLISIAYHRGVRRGVGLVWESRQRIGLRASADAPFAECPECHAQPGHHRMSCGTCGPGRTRQ